MRHHVVNSVWREEEKEKARDITNSLVVFFKGVVELSDEVGEDFLMFGI